MDYAAFLQAAGRGQPRDRPLHGPDPQLLDDALAAATRGCFAMRARPRSARGLRGRGAAVDDVMRSASTLPFMTTMRLVVVRRCQALPRKGADTSARLRARPNPSSCLLLLAEESLAASRERRDHWLLTAVAGGGHRLPGDAARPLRGAWRATRGCGGTDDQREAARLLVQWVGDDGASLSARRARRARPAAATTPRRREGGDRRRGEHRLSGVFDLHARRSAPRDRRPLRTLDRLLATEEPMRLLALLTPTRAPTMTVADLAARGRAPSRSRVSCASRPPVVDAIARGPGAAPAPVLARRLERAGGGAATEVERQRGRRAHRVVLDLCR